jgi:hypothetical protein
MKFLTFVTYEPSKTADIAQAADKVAQTPGIKPLNRYVCMGIPFPGFPQDLMCTVTISEAESSEAMAASSYPIRLAGASMWWVPVMEYEVGTAADVYKKYRG